MNVCFIDSNFVPELCGVSFNFGSPAGRYIRTIRKVYKLCLDLPIRISCYTAKMRRIVNHRGLKISGELVKAMFFTVEFLL